ncbi:MAG: DUF1993 family protein [Allosphingosinicella sp.]
MHPADLFLPTACNALGALQTWLDKAEAHARGRGEDPDALPALRLAPDMYPLSAQLRFVAFMAQEPVYRLRGEALPDALLYVRQEGWESNDAPGPLAPARARLAEAQAFLGSVDPESLGGGEERAVALDLANGMIFDLDGVGYLRDWALPQLHFHHLTAYAILRHHGVPLGKVDYVPHMWRYLREGTMPQA